LKFQTLRHVTLLRIEADVVVMDGIA